MRMGPFSNRQIIKYLNGYYVPVYVGNEDYHAGRFGETNLRMLEKIWQQAEDKELPHGTVHAWLMAPSGELMTSMHVMHAMKTTTLQRMLTEAVRELDVEPGKPLFQPQPQLKFPRVSDEQLVLHAASQYSDRNGPVGDDTIVLDRTEWQEFLPPDGIAAGQEWSISEKLAKKLLVHVYPYAPDWDLEKKKVARVDLNAYLLPSQEGNGEQKVAVRGFLQMTHNSQPGRDPLNVVAEIAGLVTPGKPGDKPEFLITTGNAIYGVRAFATLIRSVELPREKLVLETPSRH